MMRRSRSATIGSTILAGLAIAMFVFFVLSGSVVPLVLSFILLVLSGFARKRESYDDYRNRYENQFGISAEEDDDRK